MPLISVAWGAAMCASDWSSGDLERNLTGAFVLRDTEPPRTMHQGEASFFSDGVLQGSAVRQAAERLEMQDSLRREIARTHEAYRGRQAAQTKRIRELEAEMFALRRTLAEERTRLRLEHAARKRGQAHSGPPAEILLRPLVLRSRQGEFLGVTDAHGTPLTLSGFLSLVESGGSLDRVVSTCWEETVGGWGLCLGICSAGGCSSHMLLVRPMRTPSGNSVTVLTTMRVEGASVPHAFLVRMFRQLRECFQEE